MEEPVREDLGPELPVVIRPQAQEDRDLLELEEVAEELEAQVEAQRQQQQFLHPCLHLHLPKRSPAKWLCVISRRSLALPPAP